MKADRIIRNANIFTADKNRPKATALAMKDGKFVYVGDEAGLSDYEGEVTDLGGKFIMPGIIDSHVHVTLPVGFEYAEIGEQIMSRGKQGLLDSMSDYIARHPVRNVTDSCSTGSSCMRGKKSQRKISMQSVLTRSSRFRKPRGTAFG